MPLDKLLHQVALGQISEDLVSTLASGGMHGESRRAFRRYVARMNEIGVEPATFPSVGTAEPLLKPA